MKAGAEYLVMAGYMRKLTPVVLDAFPDRVLNLHPALLPSFKGAHAIQDAWDAGVKVTGVTVHLANEDYDKGPIVAQRAVPVLEGDDIDALEARIHETEHVIYPEVLRAIAEGRMTLDADRKIHIRSTARLKARSDDTEFRIFWSQNLRSESCDVGCCGSKQSKMCPVAHHFGVNSVLLVKSIRTHFSTFVTILRKILRRNP